MSGELLPCKLAMYKLLDIHGKIFRKDRPTTTVFVFVEVNSGVSNDK